MGISRTRECATCVCKRDSMRGSGLPLMLFVILPFALPMHALGMQL